MKYNYKFKIIHSTKEIIKVSDFLEKLDLNHGEIGIEETITFSTGNDHPIKILKETIKNSIESTGGKLLYIEGGKIE